LLPVAGIDETLQARAIGAGLRAEDAVAGAHGGFGLGRAFGHEAERVGAHAGGDGVHVLGLVERANGADGAIEERDLRREGVAEEAGDAQRDIDARAAELGERDDLVTRDAERAGVPLRLGADEREGLCDVVAAGAHVGGAPDAERERSEGVPLSWKWRASRFSAERRPSSHAVGVGTARLSTE
jgi:hypothetical protein